MIKELDPKVKKLQELIAEATKIESTRRYYQSDGADKQDLVAKIYKAEKIVNKYLVMTTAVQGRKDYLPPSKEVEKLSQDLEDKIKFFKVD